MIEVRVEASHLLARSLGPMRTYSIYHTDASKSLPKASLWLATAANGGSSPASPAHGLGPDQTTKERGLGPCCSYLQPLSSALPWVMPMRKTSTRSGSSGSEDGSSGRRQQNHLGDLLAEHLVEDELDRARLRHNPFSSTLEQSTSSSCCTPWLLIM